MATTNVVEADPFLRPCWRWEQVLQTVYTSDAISEIEDRTIRSAARYLRSREEHAYPVIHAARSIFEADGVLRAEIEARILTGESDALIAENVHQSHRLVEDYESLFFSVRSHLGASDWLLKNTVGDARFRGFRDGELRQLWAWFAIAGGSRVVNEVVSVYRQAVGAHYQKSLSVYFQTDSDAFRDLQANIAILVIPDDSAGNAMCCEFNLRLMEACNIKNEKRQVQAMQQIKREVIEVARRRLLNETCVTTSQPEREPPESTSQPFTPRKDEPDVKQSK